MVLAGLCASVGVSDLAIEHRCGARVYTSEHDKV